MSGMTPERLPLLLPEMGKIPGEPGFRRKDVLTIGQGKL